MASGWFRAIPASSLGAALAALLSGPLATGCANPTTAYHRNFEYLLRVGDEALAEGRLEDAREHLEEGAELAGIASASEVERIIVLTRLTRVTRELGDLAEAQSHARNASRVLARHRLGIGGTDGDVRQVGGSLLLERARVEIAMGDLAAAEEVLDAFVVLRGIDGGDDREAAEALWTLGELKRARGLDAEARAAFLAAGERAKGLDPVADTQLAGFVLLRVLEVEIADGHTTSARERLATWHPTGGVAPERSRPGVLLVQALLDLRDVNDRESAATRLDEALALLAAGGEAEAEPANPDRAIALATLLFDPKLAAARDRLAHATMRALAASGGPPLRAVLGGRAAIAVGQTLLAAGDTASGVALLEQARDAIAGAIGERDHDARVAANVALAGALAASGRLDDASDACDELVAASQRLQQRKSEKEARDAQDRRAAPQPLDTSGAPGPDQLMSCGALEVARDLPDHARRAYGLALALAGDDDPGLHMHLLLRLSALAHQQDRDVEEEKLFERLLVYVMPGAYERLSELLVESYRSQGALQPSAAAARLAHLAATLPTYSVEAPQIQALARELGADSPPASR